MKIILAGILKLSSVVIVISVLWYSNWMVGALALAGFMYAFAVMICEADDKDKRNKPR